MAIETASVRGIALIRAKLARMRVSAPSRPMRSDASFMVSPSATLRHHKFL